VEDCSCFRRTTPPPPPPDAFVIALLVWMRVIEGWKEGLKQVAFDQGSGKGELHPLPPISLLSPDCDDYD